MSFLLSLLLYQQCAVTSGTISSCPGTSFSGEAVVQQGDAYRECRITNGRIVSCSTTFSGWAPARVDGRWKRCRMSTGRIQFCDGTGWTGSVVTPR